MALGSVVPSHGIPIPLQPHPTTSPSHHIPFPCHPHPTSSPSHHVPIPFQELPHRYPYREEAISPSHPCLHVKQEDLVIEGVEPKLSGSRMMPRAQ